MKPLVVLDGKPILWDSLTQETESYAIAIGSGPVLTTVIGRGGRLALTLKPVKRRIRRSGREVLYVRSEFYRDVDPAQRASAPIIQGRIFE